MEQKGRDALRAAKLAVRAYARDPSETNAVEVEVAWHRVRLLNSIDRPRGSPVSGLQGAVTPSGAARADSSAL